ncbi:hypothetical protein ACRAWG_28580 [Methylobacterium sp. P31]
MPGATAATLARRRLRAHLPVTPAPRSAPLARIARGETQQGPQAVDPATAKTLVSAALAASITLFSLVSLQAFVAQILADLRDAGPAPKPVPVPVHAERRRPPQA